MDEARAVVLRVRPIDHRIVFDGLGRLEGNSDAARIPMFVVAILVPHDIAREAVAVMECAHDADQQLVLDQRNIDRTFYIAAVIIADLALDPAAELARRLLWHQEHRAAGRVAAKQRALRAGKDLQVLQIHEVARPALLAQCDAGGQRDFVHIDDNAR